MILEVLKNYKPYHFLLIPAIILVLWLQAFPEPGIYPFVECENAMPLYAPLHYLLAQQPLLNSMLAIALLLVMSFITLRMNANYGFIPVRTFLIPGIFALIISGYSGLHTMHPVYPAALFLLLALSRIFSIYYKENIYSDTFKAGFFIGIGSLFYFSLVFYFPVIWVGFLILRKKTEWRYFALSFMGLALPWLFTFTIYFLNDSLGRLWEVIKYNITIPRDVLLESLKVKVYLSFLVLITLWSGIALLSQYATKKSNVRKYSNLFFLIFLISATLPVAAPAVSRETFVIMAIPMTFIITNHLVYIKSSFWGNLLIILLLVMVVYMQL